MKYYPQPVVRMMETIVQAVETAVLPTIQAAELAQLQVSHPEATESNIVALNFQFGHMKEIIETMLQYDKSPVLRFKKYPLVALFLDFPETFGISGGYPGECTLQMAICYHTEYTLKTDERYAKNIKPILLPIYYELMKQIDWSGFFVTRSENHIQHLMTEHPYWGKGGLGDTAGNVFLDAVDALEISGLKLTNNFFNCKNQ